MTTNTSSQPIVHGTSGTQASSQPGAHRTSGTQAHNHSVVLLEQGTRRRSPNDFTHLEWAISRVYALVFGSEPDSANASRPSRKVRTSQTYTSLGEKLPRIITPRLWAETVVQSLFDTLEWEMPTGGYQFGTPEKNILQALERETQNKAKYISFGILHIKIQVLLRMLPSLDLHPAHASRIQNMAKQILTITGRFSPYSVE